MHKKQMVEHLTTSEVNLLIVINMTGYKSISEQQILTEVKRLWKRLLGQIVRQSENVPQPKILFHYLL